MAIYKTPQRIPLNFYKINHLNKDIIHTGIRPVILRIFYEFYSKAEMKEHPPKTTGVEAHRERV